jgi:hypothetical protein
VPQPQCRIAGDRALALDDLGDAVGRDSELARELRRRDSDLIELVCQNISGMYSCAPHRAFLLSVVVHDLDIRRAARVAGPAKADAPWVVDANAELADPVTLQGLEPVATQCPQIIEAGGCIEYRQPPRGVLRKSRECPYGKAACV